MDDRIVNRSLAEQAYLLIIKKIQRGELKQGERLNIEELSREFGVSRTPLREAISKLTQNEFLVAKHNVGPSVASFDVKKIVDLSETNSILLEGMMNVIFREADVDALCRQLYKVVETQQAAFDEGNHDAFFEASVLFHEVLIQACPNKKLSKLTMETQVQLDAFVIDYQASDQVRQSSIREHKALLMLLEDRKKEEFITALHQHNEKAATHFKDRLK